MKQETLEEAFEKFMETNFCGQLTKGIALGAMKFGAKWQQEQICDSEIIQRIRATKSDAEARRIIRTNKKEII